MPKYETGLDWVPYHKEGDPIQLGKVMLFGPGIILKDPVQHPSACQLEEAWEDGRWREGEVVEICGGSRYMVRFPDGEREVTRLREPAVPLYMLYVGQGYQGAKGETAGNFNKNRICQPVGGVCSLARHGYALCSNESILSDHLPTTGVKKRCDVWYFSWGSLASVFGVLVRFAGWRWNPFWLINKKR